MANYATMNSLVQPPLCYTSAPTTLLSAPLAITIQNNKPMLIAKSLNPKHDALNILHDILATQTSKYTPAENATKFSTCEIAQKVFQQKAKELHDQILHQGNTDVLNHSINIMQNEALPNLPYAEYASFSFDCLSGEMGEPSMEYIPTYDKRLQLANNQSIYSTGKPTLTSDIQSLHNEYVRAQNEAYSNMPSESIPTAQIRSYNSPLLKELEDIKEESITLKELSNISPLLSVQQNARTLANKENLSEILQECKERDLIDEIIEIQPHIPQIKEDVKPVCPSIAHSKKFIMQAEDEWAIEDNIDVSNFQALLPNPVLKFPFELDDFQKRAILRVEQGNVYLITSQS